MRRGPCGGTELVASHPELRPGALIVVDSFFDLTARTRALMVPSGKQTRLEIEHALGGTPSRSYRSRSPSNHLSGLATAIRGGMRLLVVWSIGPAEQREFNGATCSLTANAQWLSQLATILGRPVRAYVTRLRHRPVTFAPDAPAPPTSYCR